MHHRRSALFFLGASLLSGLALCFAPMSPDPFAEGNGKFPDFAIHIANVCAFWSYDNKSIYTPEAILQALSVVLGVSPPPGASTLPNLYSPTILFLWAPLLIPLNISLRFAFCTWLGVSLGTVFLLVRRLWHEAIPSDSFSRAWLIVGVLSILTSAAARTCLQIGQMSLFALGINGLLLRYLITHKQGRHADWSIASLLFLLSFKAPYFAIGASLTVMERRWRALARAIILIFSSILAADPIGQHRLIHDFLSTLALFSSNRSGAGRFYWSGLGENTATWLTISAGCIPSSAGHTLNTVFLGLGFLVYVLLFFKASRFDRSVRLGVTSALVVGIYLCFSPYVGFYDQILISLPLAGARQPNTRYSQIKAILVIACISFSLSSFQPLTAVFFAKVLFLLLFSCHFFQKTNVSGMTHSKP